MSISTMTITQDNKVGDSNLLPIHNPLVFLIEVEYVGADVNYIYCDVKDEDDILLATFKCIPYTDLSSTRRVFMFKADGILKGYMNDFDDIAQTVNSLIPVPDITKEFTLLFRDPEAVADDVSTTIIACRGSRQFGQNPNLTDQYNNEAENVYGEKDKECYVYFYNDDPSNIISVGSGYQVTFNIDDGVSPVNLAKITINGQSLFTDSNGQAIFFLPDGAYSYEIYKEGFELKTGSFNVTGGALIFNLSLVAIVQSVVTFHAEYSGLDKENLLVEVYRSGELIDSGTTDVNGDWVSNLYQDTYDVQVSGLEFPLTVNNFQAVISTDPQTVNIPITQIATYQVKIRVKDAGNNPIVGCQIGNGDFPTTLDPNDTWKNQTAILVTDSNGEVTVYESVGVGILTGFVATGFVSAVYPLNVAAGTNLYDIFLISE